MSRKADALNVSRAGCLKRPARFMWAALAALAAQATMPMPVEAETIATPATGQSVSDFYAARAGRPLWFGSSLGDPSAAQALIALLKSADADGLDPGRYRVERLESALASIESGSFDALDRADRAFSEALVEYAIDLRRPQPNDILWVDQQLRPRPPSPRALLEALASADSPRDYVASMGWMNPIYAGIRDAIASRGGAATDHALLRLNLERARALPGANGRYIVVNAAAARLDIFEGARVVDSMRVVVGKPVNATPMMAALIRYTSLNPYWYVPSDLAAERVAPHVVKDGLSYLSEKGYEVLSSWDSRARILDPATIDWQAVADGRQQVLVRQLPGPANAMGQMKFMFPNSAGVYLHDTPQKELLAEASRMFSGGCIRLEDAPRLARWLYGRSLQPEGSAAEQRVDLPEPVPVYITYLTAMPEHGRIAHYPDVYGRDRQALADRGAAGALASR